MAGLPETGNIGPSNIKPNKIIYGGETLIDLTEDTVSAEFLCEGITAHDKTGEIITGTMPAGGNDSDKIDRILTAGLTDGYKHYSDDGTIISTTDSENRILTKIFSDNLNVCTTTLKNQNNEILGETVHTLSENGLVIIVTDTKGQKLVKTFSEDLLTMTAVLTDADNIELARMVKTFSENGNEIHSVVTYG